MHICSLCDREKTNYASLPALMRPNPEVQARDLSLRRLRHGALPLLLGLGHLQGLQGPSEATLDLWHSATLAILYRVILHSIRFHILS